MNLPGLLGCRFCRLYHTSMPRVFAESSTPKRAPVTPTSQAADPYLAQVQKDFKKKAEMWNQQRVKELKNLKGRNIFTGLMLGTFVLSVYAYSIFTIRQETFLDDLDEPERVEPKEK